MSVSVVISTFNRWGSLRRAVQSALDQTRPPAEVVVADDGSTDATPEGMTAWARRDPRVRYVRLDHNTGMPAPARNLGARTAAADWLAFLDDDDRWLPEKLERQLAVAGDFDLVGTNARLTSGATYFPVEGEPRRFGRGDVLRDNPFILSSLLVRRELFLRGSGFPERLDRASVEDYCVVLELAALGARMVRLPEPLVVYEDTAAAHLSEVARRSAQRTLGAVVDHARAHGGLARAALPIAVHASRAAKLAARERLGR